MAKEEEILNIGLKMSNKIKQIEKSEESFLYR